MRPIPSRVLFFLLAAGSSILAARTGQLIFVIVAVLATLMLAGSLVTSRVPVTRTLSAFRGRSVDVRFWGVTPPEASGEHLVLADVNIISVGVHVFFREPAGRLLHLKVAQPRHITISADRVVIGVAKYVQWQGTKMRSAAGADAVSIALTGSLPDSTTRP